eukprot:2465183-Prymnesium_polylepis.1
MVAVGVRLWLLLRGWRVACLGVGVRLRAGGHLLELLEHAVGLAAQHDGRAQLRQAALKVHEGHALGRGRVGLCNGHVLDAPATARARHGAEDLRARVGVRMIGERVR